jgi:hypothetical protein
VTERYFDKFRLIEYTNTVAVDITQRTVFVASVYDNPLFYYQYDIAQGERPDMIADRYYKDQYQTWLIYLANKIIDPYYDWYMDPSVFDAFIIKKYGSLANAVTKIQFYRNNWYSDPNPVISADSYAVLDPSLTKFYEPVPVNGIVTGNPFEYQRRKEDWTIKTNGLATYSVASGSNFIVDEVVDIRFNLSETGQGQVEYSNEDTVILKNLSGVIDTGTIDSNSVLRGRESKAQSVFTSANIITSNIPAAETDYWSPVSYYDYEQELNEQNRSIAVIKSQYSAQATKQLKNLLK